jgi:chromosome segregation ATPase
MSELIIELVLVLILVALVSWFIGRFLCRSGEYDERQAKERIVKEHIAFKAETEKRQHKLQKYVEGLEQSLEKITPLEQQKEAAESRVKNLTEERGKLLPYVQNLDTCEKRFNTLTEDFSLQTQRLQQEKAQVIEQADEIIILQKHKLALDEMTVTLKTTSEHLETLQSEHQTLEEKYAELSKESLTYTNKIMVLSREAEMLKTERNEYLGRLRAISSVVDVVGTEPSNVPHSLGLTLDPAGDETKNSG